jgi:asparagine synthase (glutamine-hydrolysing)
LAGIAGVFGKTSRKEKVEQMLSALAHRGPDGNHIMDGPGYAIGCCQLNTGPKRMDSYAGGDKQGIVFDGLVFNRSSTYLSDAEMLLDLHRIYQQHCFSHIDGTFAVAVANEDELVLARDHVGARPIFYGNNDGVTYFASELKALKPYVDNAVELPPGKRYSSRGGIETFESFQPSVPRMRNSEKGARALKEIMFEATRKRLIDEAVGGVALSGGLDSSIIAAIALYLNPKLHLFTLGLEGSPDLDKARMVAEYLGASERHHVRIITEEEIEKIVKQAVWYLESFEEDCISGCIANMFTSQLAAKYTNCVLCGEGADELFGGYHLLKKEHNQKRRRELMDILVKIAYNTGLRRLDRGWLSSSVNYRTPFLDSHVIAFSKQIPVSWKIHGDRQVEKWILREAFKGMLPDEIIQRPKQRFASGTSVDDVMDRIAAKHLGETQTSNLPETNTGYTLHSPKELWYYRLFKQEFPSDAFEIQVSRWDPHK